MIAGKRSLDHFLLHAAEMGKTETVVEKLMHGGHSRTIAAPRPTRKLARRVVRLPWTGAMTVRVDMGVDGKGDAISIDLEELLATRLLVQGKSMSDLVEVEVPRTVQLYAPVVTADNVDQFIDTAFES